MARTKKAGIYKNKRSEANCGRARAVKLYKIIGRCEMCEDNATDRHHVDENTSNNERDNLLFLCRRCHMKVDGRLEKLASITPPIQEPKECSVCNELAKPLRKGVCHRCNEYFRRNGRQRPKWTDKSRVLTDKTLMLILKLRNQRLSYDKIRDITGISSCTIRTHCIKNRCVFNLKYKDGKQRYLKHKRYCVTKV